jgi:hypothetical protein
MTLLVVVVVVVVVLIRQALGHRLLLMLGTSGAMILLPTCLYDVDRDNITCTFYPSSHPQLVLNCIALLMCSLFDISAHTSMVFFLSSLF